MILVLGEVVAVLGGAALAGAALWVGISRRIRQLRSDDDRAELYRTGSLAVACISWAVYGQEAVGDDPVVRAWFRLTPVNGSDPVEVTRDMLLSELTVPWAADGFTAVYDPAQPNRFVLVTKVTDGDGTPARVVELFRRVPETRTTVEPPPLVAAIARLGAIEHELRAGTLTRKEYAREAAELFDVHFS